MNNTNTVFNNENNDIKHNSNISIKRSILIMLILDFLKQENYDKTMISLELETGLCLFNYPKELFFLRNLILEGQFKNAEDFLSPFEEILDSANFKECLFELRKQKFLELIESDKSNVEELVEMLNDLYNLNVNQADFNKLVQCLSNCDNLLNNPNYSDWTILSGRLKCFEVIRIKLNTAFPLDKQERNIDKNMFVNVIRDYILNESLNNNSSINKRCLLEGSFKLNNNTKEFNSNVNLVIINDLNNNNINKESFNNTNNNANITHNKNDNLFNSIKDNDINELLMSARIEKSNLIDNFNKINKSSNIKLNKEINAYSLNIDENNQKNSTLIINNKNIDSIDKKLNNKEINASDKEIIIKRNSSTLKENSTKAEKLIINKDSKSNIVNKTSNNLENTNKISLYNDDDKFNFVEDNEYNFNDRVQEDEDDEEIINSRLKEMHNTEYDYTKLKDEDIINYTNNITKDNNDNNNNNNNMNCFEKTSESDIDKYKFTSTESKINTYKIDKNNDVIDEEDENYNESMINKLDENNNNLYNNKYIKNDIDSTNINNELKNSFIDNKDKLDDLDKEELINTKLDYDNYKYNINNFACIVKIKDIKPIRTSCFSPGKGDFLALGTNSCSLKIFDIRSLTDIYVKNSNTYKYNVYNSVNISSNTNNSLSFKDIKQLKDFEKHHNGSIYSIDWSCTGRLIASGSNDQLVKCMVVPTSIENVNTFNDNNNNNNNIQSKDFIEEDEEKLELIMQGHKGIVRNVSFDPLEELSLLSCGQKDNNIFVWDTEEGVIKALLEGHFGDVYSIKWSSNNNQLCASSGEDKTIRFWDLRTCKPTKVISTLKHDSINDIDIFTRNKNVNF